MDSLTCPSCGTELKARVSLSTLVKQKTKLFAAQSWMGHGANSLKEIENTYVPPVRTPAVPGKATTPVRAPSIEADVLVPLSYAIIPAIPIAILIWLGWIMAGWRYPGYAVPGFFFSVVLGFWLLNQGSWYSLLWRFEEWLGADVNKDSQVSKPKSDNSMVWVTIKDKNGGSVSKPILPRGTRRLIAEAIRNGGKFSRRSLCPECLPEDSYSPIRQKMLGLQLLKPVTNHGDRPVPDNAKVELTPEGLEFLGVESEQK